MGPGCRVRDLDRDGIPAWTMVTGGHPRREGPGVSSPIQDAIALCAAFSLWVRDGWYTRMVNTGGPTTPELQHMTSPVDAVEARIDGGQKTILRALRCRATRQSPPIYLVGGPVRDVLLDSPIGDLDFVVEGDAPSLARDVATEVRGEVVVHQAFGTATISLEDHRVDIVTARKETYPSPGALPRVTPGAIADDLARRDFSINAMAIPLGAGQSRVLDEHGGMEDLKAGIVRILHQESFVDDPTRVFRAARYEQRLGFRLEEDTEHRLKEAVSSGFIKLLSPDRARHEIERIFRELNPAAGLERLAGLGVLTEISQSWREVDAVRRLNQEPPEASNHSAGGGIAPMTYLAALVYTMTAAQVEDLVRRLNMPNSWAKVVRDTRTVRDLETELAGPDLLNSRIARLLQPLSEDALRAVAHVTPTGLAARRVRAFLNELRSVSPELDGTGLLALGAPPGPELGRILNELFDAKLDGRVNTVEDERRFVHEALVPRGGRQVG